MSSPTMSPPSTLSSPTSSRSAMSEVAPSRRKTRVSAEHTLTRVRENQRRHRARRRDYIATLEVQLAETELQLEAARAEIAMLRAEREASMTGGMKRGAQERSTGFVFDFQDVGRGVSEEMGERGGPNKHSALELLRLGQETGMDLDMELSMEYPARISGTGTGSTPASTSPSSTSQTPQSTSSLPALLDEIHNPECLPLPPTGPPPCCTDNLSTPSIPLEAFISQSPTDTPPSVNPSEYPITDLTTPTDVNPECTTCATRPAPSPSESTTLCSQAYMLISQQNFRQIDAGTIRLWLWQGYRRAQRRGEGCRVENGVLLSVLDFISGEL